MPGWGVAALFLLLLPVLAMQVTTEVAWGPGDFVVAGVLLFGAGITYERLARRMDGVAYRAAVGIAVGAALLLVWTNLAVGIIGDEGDPANLMYAGVLAVGLVGALVARLQPRGMARAAFGTAVALILVAAIALSAGSGSPGSGPLEIVALNGFFAALFVGSALLFRKAARGTPERARPDLRTPSS